MAGMPLNFFKYSCYIHSRVPLITDSEGNVKTKEVPWTRAGSGFTLMFEALQLFQRQLSSFLENVQRTSLKKTPNDFR
jgi:hypothetical protein